MNKGIVVAVVLVIGVALGGFFLFGRSGTESREKKMPVQNEREVDTEVITEVEDVVEVEEEVGEVKEFVVTGSNYKYSPTELRVKKGETVRILFKSVGAMHDFNIEEFDVATDQINDGEEEEVEFLADKSGSFEYYCSVGSHRAKGMKGNLMVE